MSYSKVLANVVREVLEEEEWGFDFDEEKGFFTPYRLSLNNKLGSCTMFIDVREESIICYSNIAPKATDEKSKSSAMEYLTRANYGLRSGNFEIDLEDGSMRFKCYLECGQGIPDKIAVGRLLWSAGIWERYGDNLLAVLLGVKEPEQAIKDAEEEN